MNMRTRVRHMKKKQLSDEQLSDRRASLGIMWDQLRAHLKDVGPSQHRCIEGFTGPSQHRRTEGFKGTSQHRRIEGVKGAYTRQFLEQGCHFFLSGWGRRSYLNAYPTP